MSSMERLQSDKFHPCIDLIDSLRSLGVEQDLALPAIAVIGDQSSGKSSVLEALSGVELPKDRNYILVLKMMKTNGEWCGIVKFQKHESTQEKRIHNPKDVEKLIKEVKPWNFSLHSKGHVILEITSPDVPDLTLIDLPSIPTVVDKTADQIKCTIKKYITKPETIILVVVPCNVDIATTEALKMAQEVDSDGERTMGILTKPDLVNQVKEKTIVEIAQNKVISLKKGFTIVRCYDRTKVSQMDHITKEDNFFKDHTVFKPLYDDGYATIPKLAERLSQELAQHIQNCLPQLKEYIKNELLQANAELKRYGNAPPSDEAGRLSFLTDKLTTFTQDVIRLSTGELLELTDQKVFSVWRKILKNSDESFKWKLEAEVAQYEQKNPESGFSNFKTFEHVIKDEIKLLEEPAVFTLKDSAEIVKKELLNLMEKSFIGFPDLISKAQSAISDVTSRSQKAAEFLLRSQFKMELFEVYTEGRTCSKQKRDKKKSTTTQLLSYYQTVCQRLVSYIPMVIRFHILKESSDELQKDMLHILKQQNVLDFLDYDYNITKLRDKTQRRFIPLTKAQMLLSEL